VARRSRVEGPNILRRKLRRVEPEILRGVQDVLRDGLNRIQRDSMSMTPVDEGDLRDSIEVKLSRDKLSGIVGPGAGAAEIMRRKAGSAFATSSPKARLSKRNTRALWNFFKGYWHEFGTKGSTKWNLPPIRPVRFMSRSYDANREWIRRRSDAAIRNALEKASRG
jgi:hypothetical protein